MKVTRNSAFLAFGGVALAGTAAVAGNGVGGVFNLGETNTVDATTQLSGAPRAPQLHVINNSRQNGAAGVSASAGRAGVNYGVYATTASSTGYAGYFQNTSTTTNAALGRGIRSLAAGASTALFNPGDGAAGGEFAGPNGMIGVASHPAGAGVVGRAGQGTYGVFGASANADGFGGYFQNSSTTTDAFKGTCIRGLAAGARESLFDTRTGFTGGGEFAGPDGVVGVSSGFGGTGVAGFSGDRTACTAPRIIGTAMAASSRTAARTTRIVLTELGFWF